jgi:hypothetical protein
MDEYEEAVLFTFALLESRLDRLEYVLRGVKETKGEKPKTVTERMHKIDKSLQELSAKTALLNDARELCTCPCVRLECTKLIGAVNKHKDILKPEKPQPDAGLDASQKAVMVVERAPAFATIASQLKALDDQQIPQTDGFTKLAKLRPRIAEAEDRHLQQALQISLLRKNSGLLVQRVKQIHRLGPARVWIEWHKRVANAERTVARIEYKQKQEDDEVL